MSYKLLFLPVFFSFLLLQPGDFLCAAEREAGPVKLTPKQERRRLKRLEKELEGPFRRWLKQDVVYIITGDEKRAFLRLTTAEERENFTEQFWLRRDPTPDTLENEYK